MSSIKQNHLTFWATVYFYEITDKQPGVVLVAPWLWYTAAAAVVAVVLADSKTNQIIPY